MNIWLKNSIKNILPLSEETNDFDVAIKEWFFTGEIIDHGESKEICNLCEKGDLRYHFQIANKLDNILWIGSSCIDKFDISVYDEDGKEVTENKKEYLSKQVRLKHISKAIETLGYTNRQDTIGGHTKESLDTYCIVSYLNHKQFDAKMLSYLFMRFEEENIPFEKSFFSINLQSQYNKEMLSNLKPKQYERIRVSLSSSQRKFYENNRHKT